MKPRKPKRDLSPPWILFFGDDGKPFSIMPAGRSGEVAIIKGLSMRAARAIVNAANQPIRDAHIELVDLSKKILALHNDIEAAKKARSDE